MVDYALCFKLEQLMCVVSAAEQNLKEANKEQLLAVEKELEELMRIEDGYGAQKLSLFTRAIQVIRRLERWEYKLTTMKYITMNPEIRSGLPCFAGTRVPVRGILDMLEYDSIETILEGYPSLSKELISGAKTEWFENNVCDIHEKVMKDLIKEL